MTRFQLSLISTLLASSLWLAQLATSFSLVRFGCVIVLVAYFLAIAVDAALDYAKTQAAGHDAELLTVVTPHIAYAIGLLFLIVVGVVIGL